MVNRHGSRSGVLVVLATAASVWGLLLLVAVYAAVVATTTTTTTTSHAPRSFHTPAGVVLGIPTEPQSGNTINARSGSYNNNSKDNNSTGTVPTQHRSNSLPNQIWDIVSSMVHGGGGGRNNRPQLVPPVSSFSLSSSSSTAGACRSYLAPSTLPGAGLGMFAGRHFVEGDHVTTGDAVVPLLDVDWNNYYKNKKNFLWDDYIWSGSTFAGMTEPTYYDIDGASFGIGAIPNCHFGLLNLEETKVKRDVANVPRDHPATGSFTPFHDRISYASHDIVAGAELFVDYGYGYFKGSRTKTIGYIPFLDDYEVADALLVKLDRLWNRTRYHHRHDQLPHHNECRATVTVTGDVLEEAASLSTGCSTNSGRGGGGSSSVLSEDIYEDILQTTKEILSAWPTRTTMALPDSVKDIAALQAAGGTIKKDYPKSIRSVEYLEEYGTCMDHVAVRPSTIPGAGRGAFATRSLSRGTVVAPIPLIHLPERAVLNVHAWAGYDDDDGENFHGPIIHQQLLLNYCFGHANTTMVLCPYGVGSSLINHGHKDRANVKVVWSNKTMVHPEWLDKPIKEWAYDSGSGLCFDYIATHDIAEGEEILLDYGDDWQRAWDQHVATWQPVERLTDRLNEDIDGIIPTESEWAYSMGNPNDDPNAASLWCYNAYRLIQKLPRAKNMAYPCKVILRNEDGTYMAEIVMRLQNEKGDQCEVAFDEALWAVPRDALAYGGPFEVDDTRDQWNPKTFRHHISMPDHLLPVAWQNNVVVPEQQQQQQQQH